MCQEYWNGSNQDYYHGLIALVDLYCVPIRVKLTFLYRRAIKHPLHYHIQQGTKEEMESQLLGKTTSTRVDNSINDLPTEICRSTVAELASYSMINLNSETSRVTPLGKQPMTAETIATNSMEDLGISLSRSGVSFETVKRFCELEEDTEMETLLRALVQAEEYAFVVLVGLALTLR